jgi:hypothetical protein
LALTLTLLLAAKALGQSGTASITVNGHVSEAVFVSIAPGAQLSDDQMLLTYSNLGPRSLRLSISTIGSDVRRISIPIQLRSNVPYTLSANANLSETTLRKLCLTGARTTGRFVAADAVKAINTAGCETQTATARPGGLNRGALPFSSPYTLLEGSRISLAGTFDTPSNALEVMLLVEVEPHAGQKNGSIEMTLSALPASGASAVVNDAGEASLESPSN